MIADQNKMQKFKKPFFIYDKEGPKGRVQQGIRAQSSFFSAPFNSPSFS